MSCQRQHQRQQKVSIPSLRFFVITMFLLVQIFLNGRMLSPQPVTAWSTSTFRNSNSNSLRIGRHCNHNNNIGGIQRRNKSSATKPPLCWTQITCCQSLQKSTRSLSLPRQHSRLFNDSVGRLYSVQKEENINEGHNGSDDSALISNHQSTSSSKFLVPLPSTPYDDGQRPFQITTPIYYVNDKPHIGHAYTSTACDVIARFMRLSGREVCFVTGTDEHGQKVEQSAAKQGVPPQEFVDSVSTNFRDLLTTLNIQNDIFIRTTQTDHKIAVQHLWNVLCEKGYIYKGNYEGWYSVRDECFFTELELVEGKAPTGAEVEWVAKEESYFFKLSAFQDKLLHHYEVENQHFIAPEGRRNEVLSFVRGGLRDLSISRTSFKWGVPVPDDPSHVVYVWIDALTNYLSALGYPSMKDNVSMYWPCALHVVGKDILRFHAVYWPAMLMAADLPLPKRVFAHGWWTKDGQKISKSIGNVIDPIQLVEKYGVDPTRFFLMSEVNFGSDGDFSDRAMILKVNSNLANELGNLCQRTLSMVHKNCNAAIPLKVGPYTDADSLLLKSAEELWSRAATAISTQALHKYVDVMVQQIVDTNKYIDDMAPWVLRKTDPERMATVLYVIMEVLRYAAILYQPLIPDSAHKILNQLTVPVGERTFFHLSNAYCIQPGTPITKPEGIFPRIELPASEDLVEATSAAVR